jgi:SagB-type dehydrogenase family enzyme
MVSSTAPSWRSHGSDSRPARERLHRLVGLLSDDECRQLLTLVEDVAAGERPWEGDFGLLYNEFVKMRFFRVARNRPAAPASERNAFVPIGITKSYPGAEQVSLPAPPPLAASLGQTLERRRSVRAYTGAAIDARRLSALLHYGCGVTAHVPAYGFERLPLRTQPSHGGLQSPEVYLWAGASEGLDAGLYHYEPGRHVLELLEPGDHRDGLRDVAFGEEYVARAGAVFLITVVYDRLRWKYGDRAYRFACTDVGFLGQNLYLVAEALGLGACAVSGFAQDRAEELLGVDGKAELAMLLLTVGVKASESEA